MTAKEYETYSEDLLEAARSVTTATLTTVLLKMGLTNIWIRGAFPLADQSRVAGPAFTLRFIPSRNDLATPESWSAPISTRTAIEAMPKGCVAVVDAGGVRDAGVFGDILCERMHVREVAALITDGVLRDREGVVQTGLSVWAAGIAAPPSVAGLTFVGWDDAIGCGGVAVIPGDLIVADQDGAVVVPKALVEKVISAATEQENLEAWIVDQVRDGHALPGLYPPNEENQRRYRDSK